MQSFDIVTLITVILGPLRDFPDSLIRLTAWLLAASPPPTNQGRTVGRLIGHAISGHLIGSSAPTRGLWGSGEGIRR